VPTRPERQHAKLWIRVRITPGHLPGPLFRFYAQTTNLFETKCFVIRCDSSAKGKKRRECASVVLNPKTVRVAGPRIRRQELRSFAENELKSRRTDAGVFPQPRIFSRAT
jgi:hypothetical protein